MKKIIFLMYLMATSVLSFAQDYKKTVLEGKEWEITLQTGMGGEPLTNYYHIACDTIIDDQVYYQVVSEAYEAARGFVREDTIAQQVYFWSNDSISERLVLDYQLEKGDPFDFGGGYVLEVDSVYYTDSAAKVILFPFISQYYFLEGVGHNFNGIIHNIQGWQQAAINDTLNVCGLTSTEDNVRMEGDLKTYPNPTKDRLYVTTDLKNTLNYTIVDVNGVIRDRGILNGSMELNVSHLENGLYYLKITNGKQSKVEKVLISR